MRRKEKEITDFHLIEKILNEAEICHIGLSMNDEPYVVPVNFGYSNRIIWFHSAIEGKKADIIRENPRVCIQAQTGVSIHETDNPCNWSTCYHSVIGYGNVRLVTDPEEKQKALGWIVRHYKKDLPESYDFGDIRRLSVYAVDLDTITGKQSV